jgi:hypothetical protein
MTGPEWDRSVDSGDHIRRVSLDLTGLKVKIRLGISRGSKTAGEEEEYRRSQKSFHINLIAGG